MKFDWENWADDVHIIHVDQEIPHYGIGNKMDWIRDEVSKVHGVVEMKRLNRFSLRIERGRMFAWGPIHKGVENVLLEYFGRQQAPPPPKPDMADNSVIRWSMLVWLFLIFMVACSFTVYWMSPRGDSLWMILHQFFN